MAIERWCLQKSRGVMCTITYTSDGAVLRTVCALKRHWWRKSKGVKNNTVYCWFVLRRIYFLDFRNQFKTNRGCFHFLFSCPNQNIPNFAFSLMDEFCIYACIQRINPKTESFHGKSDFVYLSKPLTISTKITLSSKPNTSNNRYRNYII